MPEPIYIGYRRFPLHVYRGTDADGFTRLIVESSVRDAEDTWYEVSSGDQSLEWEQVPDDELLTIHYAAGDWNVGAPEWDVTLPAGGWARASGTPRLLASTTTPE